MSWFRFKTHSPREVLWSTPCAGCEHFAGQHRWVEARAGQHELKFKKYKTRCHQCTCPHYRRGLT